jgi:hypothetical protein
VIPELYMPPKPAIIRSAQDIIVPAMLPGIVPVVIADVGRGPAATIDRTSGTIIFEGTVGVNISNTAEAFDGITSQAAGDGVFRNNAGNPTRLAIGKTFPSPVAIESATAHGSSNAGFDHNGNRTVTLYLMGKSGTAPSGAIANWIPGGGGTTLGSTSFTDVNNANAHVVNSTDVDTYWDHVWLVVDVAANANVCLSELILVGWVQ